MNTVIKKQQGYVVDLPYSFSFYQEMQPLWLASAAQFIGLQPPKLTEAFRYCELGCGLAVNLLVAATLYPQGHFVGVDFNAEQLELARRGAAAAGLSNIELIHADFASFAAQQHLPFDFMVCHGTWSWVSSQNQLHILRTVQQHLSSGALFYLHYMCQPGSERMRPVQKLMQQVDRSLPAYSSAQSIEQAKQLLRQLNQAGVFSHQLGMTEHVAALCERHANYLAHEFLTDHWQPEHSTDVHQRVAQVGLSYVCSANLFDNLDMLSVPAEVQPILASVKDPALRECVKDLARNQQQRQDLFQYQPKPLSSALQLSTVQTMQFQLLPNAPKADVLQFKTPIGHIPAPPALFVPLLTRLQQGIASFKDLQQLSVFQQQTAVLLQVLQMLIWAKYLHPVLPIQHSDVQQQQQLTAWFKQQGIALQLIPQCGTAVHLPLTTEFTS